MLKPFQDESSIESDEFDMSDSTRMSAVNSDLSSNLEERMQSPQALHGQQDGKPFKLSKQNNNIILDQNWLKQPLLILVVIFYLFLWRLFLYTKVILSKNHYSLDATTWIKTVNASYKISSLPHV